MHCGFPVLLKLIEFSHTKREKELSRRGRGGGYDFHHRTSRGATMLVCGGVATEDVLAMIAEAKNPHEARQAREGILALRRWLVSADGKPFEVEPTTYHSPNKIFSVRMEPEFGLREADEHHLYAAWNTKTPDLTRIAAAIGARTMERAYADIYPNARCHVMNLRAGKPYDALPATSENDHRVDREIASLERLIKSLGL